MNERWIGGTVRHSYAFGRAAILLAGLFFVIATGHSIAQGTGSIGGTVVDASQAAIAGSQVTLTNTETAQTRATSASDQGLFEFPDLPPGVYKVSVNKTGSKCGSNPQSHLPLPNISPSIRSSKLAPQRSKSKLHLKPHFLPPITALSLELSNLNRLSSCR